MKKLTKGCYLTRLKLVIEHCQNLITLFDVQAGRYKSVNLDTVTSVRCGSKVVWEEK
jgi:hypothetical protein